MTLLLGLGNVPKRRAAGQPVTFLLCSRQLTMASLLSELNRICRPRTADKPTASETAKAMLAAYSSSIYLMDSDGSKLMVWQHS